MKTRTLLTGRLFPVLCFLCWLNPLQAEEQVDYLKQIKPILKSRCFACHGTLKQESSLRVDSSMFLLKGGDAGPAVVPHDLEESWLYQTITGEAGFLMPPEGEGHPLKKEEITLIKKWIEAGAQFPENDTPEEDPRNHWAFQPIKRPVVPVVKNDDWVNNPIDYFIAAKHQARNLVPQKEADKATLLRRLYLDLIGLPPSREELHAFLKDDRPDAYEYQVEKLLNSPRYGERWGRHWMDVWRYSDWYGRRAVPDMTNSYSLMWQWRDWIIRSLNEDKGYDQMLSEMLAADEIAPENPENHAATGFIVRNYYRWNYHTWYKDQVEHTGKAFLGLTLNCCECHDHKYDPIGQDEYFAFRAFFEQIDLRHDRRPGETDPGPFEDYKLGVLAKPVRTGRVRIYDRHLEKETRFYTGGVETNIDENREPISPAAPAFLNGNQIEVERRQIPARTWYPGLQKFVIAEETVKRQNAYDAALKRWKALEPEYQTAKKSLDELATQLEHSRPDQGREGKQFALQLNATNGRRAVQHCLPTPWERFDNHTRLSFEIRIIKEGLVNFQLSNDFASGRTNLYVVFNNGNLIAWLPGSTQNQVIGQYDTSAPLKHFKAVLQFQSELDQALLTIHDLANDNQTLIENVVIGLNGWQPEASENCGIFLDTHSGTIAEYDNVLIEQTDLKTENREWLHLDFEGPEYEPGNDISGANLWQVSRFSQGGISQIVLAEPSSPEMTAWLTKKQKLLNQSEDLQMKYEPVRSAVLAAESELKAYLARVAVEEAKYVHQLPQEKIDELIKAASLAERMAAFKQAESNWISAKSQLKEAQKAPAETKDREKKITTASKSLTTAEKIKVEADKKLKADSSEYTLLSRQFPRESNGKRIALAEWITAKENPLTARVAVNHLWLRHFGQPIVGSVYNFGRSGDRPTHLGLINWLAAELQEHDWSMKHLHRLIVLSATYRQNSQSFPEDHPNLEIDRDNVYLWRFPTRRMEAEVVRDTILKTTGALDNRFFGQELEHEEGLTSFRRSLYYSHQGESKMQFLEMFDGANACDCYRRTSSVMPQQALALTNSELTVKQARRIATRLWKELEPQPTSDHSAQFVESAFEQILSKTPTEEELKLSLYFLEKQEHLYSENQEVLQAAPKPSQEGETVIPVLSLTPAIRARESFIQALFSHNDFVTIR